MWQWPRPVNLSPGRVFNSESGGSYSDSPKVWRSAQSSARKNLVAAFNQVEVDLPAVGMSEDRRSGDTQRSSTALQAAASLPLPAAEPDEVAHMMRALSVKGSQGRSERLQKRQIERAVGTANKVIREASRSLGQRKALKVALSVAGAGSSSSSSSDSSQLHDMQEKCECLKQLVAKQAATISALENKLGEQTAVAAAVRKEVQQVQSGMSQLRDSVAAIQKGESASIRDSTANLKQDIQSLRTAVSGLQKQPAPNVKKMEKEIAELFTKLSALQEVQREAEGERAVWAAQIDECQQAVKTPGRTAAAAPHQQVEMLQKTVSELQQQQQKMQQKVESGELLRTFKVVGKLPTKASKASSDRAQVLTALAPLEMDQIAVEYVRALKGKDGKPGSGPILFRVTHAADAEQLRRTRKGLKGMGYAIVDQLSDEEYSMFKELKPKAEEARRDGGKRVWWVRARLFIDGQEISISSNGGGGSTVQGAWAKGPPKQQNRA